MEANIKIAVLDDYQRVSQSFADWSLIKSKADVTVFTDHISDEAALVQRLLPFRILCVMRERTPLPRHILVKLTNLKLIVSTGQRNASIDRTAAEELGITITPTGYHTSGAPELTWALLMAIARHIPTENVSTRAGGWQRSVGTDLKGKTIGIIGLGNIGSKIAAYAHAFDMQVIAWSENLTSGQAQQQGAILVTKEALFREADFVSIHLVLSHRSRGIVTAKELNAMKPTAYLINTSRGPLVDERALIAVLKERKIAGAALDVFDQEPLPADHQFRQLDNVLITPHIGYVTEDTYRLFYQDTVKAILNWL
jgi:phosphoglycerate dehydrogenase-like enzyme